MTTVKNGRADMKTDEAFKELESRIRLIDKDYPDMVEYKETIKLATKALKMQIPQKPDNIKTIFDFSGRYYTTRGDCHVCGEEGLFRSQNYCYKCGQKLDWGDD